MQFDQLIQSISIAAIPLIFAITLHEAAHGYVARYFGDMTADRAGRITLNPIRHIDPVGTILLPVMMYWATSGAFTFGWAKPVPVNFGALRDPKKNMFWVALAGPASNFLMAIIWVLVAKLAVNFPGDYYTVPLLKMAQFGLLINVVLIALNMLPVPPLDGGRIAVSLLPHKLALMLSRIEPYGIFILIFMAFTGILNQVLKPVMSVLVNLITFIV
jgi:Zn-dependent protease